MIIKFYSNNDIESQNISSTNTHSKKKITNKIIIISISLITIIIGSFIIWKFIQNNQNQEQKKQKEEEEAPPGIKEEPKIKKQKEAEEQAKKEQERLEKEQEQLRTQKEIEEKKRLEQQKEAEEQAKKEEEYYNEIKNIIFTQIQEENKDKIYTYNNNCYFNISILIKTILYYNRTNSEKINLDVFIKKYKTKILNLLKNLFKTLINFTMIIFYNPQKNRIIGEQTIELQQEKIIKIIQQLISSIFSDNIANNIYCSYEEKMFYLCNTIDQINNDIKTYNKMLSMSNISQHEQTEILLNIQKLTEEKNTINNKTSEIIIKIIDQIGKEFDNIQKETKEKFNKVLESSNKIINKNNNNKNINQEEKESTSEEIKQARINALKK
jgi:flagellar motor protein MotB